MDFICYNFLILVIIRIPNIEINAPKEMAIQYCKIFFVSKFSSKINCKSTPREIINPLIIIKRPINLDGDFLIIKKLTNGKINVGSPNRSCLN